MFLLVRIMIVIGELFNNSVLMGYGLATICTRVGILNATVFYVNVSKILTKVCHLLLRA